MAANIALGLAVYALMAEKDEVLAEAVGGVPHSEVKAQSNCCLLARCESLRAVVVVTAVEGISPDPGPPRPAS